MIYKLNITHFFISWWTIFFLLHKKINVWNDDVDKKKLLNRLSYIHNSLLNEYIDHHVNF